jgi:hypothetical protein
MSATYALVNDRLSRSLMDFLQAAASKVGFGHIPPAFSGLVYAPQRCSVTTLSLRNWGQ